MPKSKWNLNTIYISERLQESLQPISCCALTTVVAPMGYGKTTAVNWYLEQCAKAEALNVIRISVYSDNLEIFWKSVQNAFVRAGFDFLRDYTCPTDADGGELLADDLCHELAGETACYIFIDDFHLLTDSRVSDFLCTLANRMPGNVHLIVASRDRFLPAGEIVRLGGKIYQIGTEHLRLKYKELAIYAHRCGTELSDAQVDALLYSSEGWFSAVYLNLRTLSERGALPDRNSDIYSMFTAAMIDPLPEKQQEFLAVMGLADEFTVEMARFGLWYENCGQYLHAIASYRRGGKYDALLRVIQKDAGILLAALKPTDVLEMLEGCPTETLKAHPLSLLVLMRRMFTWRQIPKMMELKALLLNSVEEHPELSSEERGNLLGECDLIMSFLCYNDISTMSRLHRSASSQMSRPAISIQNSGGWTFDSPSVLMMYYRAPGELQSELAEMDECMPHYYKITDGHGQGAETIMRAEAAFMQGRFMDAHIELESAYAQIEGNGQENMALCCDFLARRLSLHMDMEQRYSFEERHEALLHKHNATWLNIWSATSAYYHALLGETDKIPVVFAEHKLSTINFLAPGKPMMELIENQVYLAQGAYAKVIGRCEGQLAVCDAMHYALVALHIRIQAAAAYGMLGKNREAGDLLIQALADAEPDGFIIPFVENYRYLKPLLEPEIQGGLVRKIVELGEAAGQHKSSTDRPMIFTALTEREYEIVLLMAEHLTNREIAGKLFLSEGSVKQYINQIYSKLNIEGDARGKRKRLLTLLSQKT